MNYDEKIRYARNIILPQIGEAGQEKLLSSKVLVLGAGGLGSPLILYLAASGVGTIGIIDNDKVALSNLQRQIIHESSDIGRAKVSSASDSVSYLNPDVNVITYDERINEDNIDHIISEYDIVADGCDNFETRFLVNESCFKNHKTLVSAAILGFSGQLYSFKPYIAGDNPCYNCIYPEMPPSDVVPSCSEAGIIGSVAGIMGSWQATEVIKEIVGFGESLSGSMIVFDALTASSKKVKVHRDSECICCSKNARGS